MFTSERSGSIIEEKEAADPMFPEEGRILIGGEDPSYGKVTDQTNGG
jgi:hypothetical protein